MSEEYIELYKKYRPTKWAGLIGQEKTANSLRNAVLADKIPTAYLFSGQRGCGKDLHKDTLLPTPTGFTTMGEVKVGDALLGSDGSPTTVLQKYCPMDPEMYEITFSDGAKVRAGSGHLWETYTKQMRLNETHEKNKLRKKIYQEEDIKTLIDLPEEIITVSQISNHCHVSLSAVSKHLKKENVKPIKNQRRTQFFNKYEVVAALKNINTVFVNDQRRTEPNVVTTKDILKTLTVTKKREKNHSVKTITGPAQFNSNKKLDISPYVLGVWLGDGYSSSGVICGEKEDMKNIIASILSSGLEVKFLREDYRNSNVHSYRVFNKNKTLTTSLKNLGVLNNKHIPSEYLFSSVENRLALLRGLMDTDGSIDKKGIPTFSQKEGRLFDQFLILIHSLGWKSHTRTKKHKNSRGELIMHKEVAFYPDQQVFTLPRKAKKLEKSMTQWSSCVLHRYIVDIKKVYDNPEDYFCISVDSKNQLFLCTEHFIPTHNTSAALLLAKSLNCEDRKENGDPCNECEVCLNIDKGTQLGVTYLSMANKGSAEDVRELVRQARLNQPVKKQVFILDEIHTISKQAADALLIPLEEKGMSSLFIFCTTAIDRVPQTILSRLQQRKFNLVDSSVLTAHVKRIVKHSQLEATEEDIANAVRLGRGSVRDTLSALDTVLATGEASVSHNGKILEALGHRDISQVYAAIAQANSDSADFPEMSEQLFEDLRDLLLIDAGVDREFIGIPPVEDEEKIIKALGGQRGIQIYLHEVGEAITKMSMGADGRILLEVSLLKALVTLRKLIAVQAANKA